MLTLKYKTGQENSALLNALGLTAILLYISEASRQEKLKTMHPAVLLAKSLIHKHFQNELTLQVLAQEAQVSSKHLIRLFTVHHGMTPTQYIWQIRVKRATDLLIHTGLTITEVAYQCGFKTSYHFARLFKKLTGLTPTEMRNQHWDS